MHKGIFDGGKKIRRVLKQKKVFCGLLRSSLSLAAQLHNQTGLGSSALCASPLQATQPPKACTVVSGEEELVWLDLASRPENLNKNTQRRIQHTSHPQQSSISQGKTKTEEANIGGKGERGRHA